MSVPLLDLCPSHVSFCNRYSNEFSCSSTSLLLNPHHGVFMFSSYFSIRSIEKTFSHSNDFQSFKHSSSNNKSSQNAFCYFSCNFPMKLFKSFPGFFILLTWVLFENWLLVSWQTMKTSCQNKIKLSPCATNVFNSLHEKKSWKVLSICRRRSIDWTNHFWVFELNVMEILVWILASKE